MLYDLDIIKEFKTTEEILLARKLEIKERISKLLDEYKDYFNYILKHADKNKSFVTINNNDFSNKLSEIISELNNNMTDTILDEANLILKDNYIRYSSLLRGGNKILFSDLYIDVDSMLKDIKNGLLK